jgi:hypothetical protein
MDIEPTFCGFCGGAIQSEGSMQLWTEDGELKGLILVVNGREVRHACKR